jgi:hypothetical protein
LADFPHAVRIGYFGAFSYALQILSLSGDKTMAGDAYGGKLRNINTSGGNYNERIEGNYVQGNYYAGGEPKNLADAATEIQALLEQLDKTYPTNTTMGKMAIGY